MLVVVVLGIGLMMGMWFGDIGWKLMWLCRVDGLMVLVKFGSRWLRCLILL